MRGRQPLLSYLEGRLTAVQTFLESPQLKARRGVDDKRPARLHLVVGDILLNT
jgi:hypothetical protein